MCVEGASGKACDKCSLQGKDYCTKVCCDSFRSDNTIVYFTNKLIFSAEGIKLQIKRKGAKVKVKVLELSDEEFKEIKNDKITITKDENISSIYKDALVLDSYNTKYKYYFNTEQEAITWVEALFSLRGDV